MALCRNKIKEDIKQKKNKGKEIWNINNTKKIDESYSLQKNEEFLS